MKNNRFLILLITLFVLTFCVATLLRKYMDTVVVPVKNTTISITEGEKNIGVVRTTDTTAVVFSITNTGEHDLVIKNVTPDCDCTIPAWSPKTIQPNDTDEIMLYFIPKEKGLFLKTVVVETNTPTSPIILVFRGKAVQKSQNF